jgi:hypothetical protein
MISFTISLPHAMAEITNIQYNFFSTVRRKIEKLFKIGRSGFSVLIIKNLGITVTGM